VNPRSPLDFPRGLILSGWLALTILGPIALFATWYGDRFGLLARRQPP